MNLILDLLIRRVVREPGFRDTARAEPQAVADRSGLPVADVTAVLEGDLLALHRRGAHPLLIMHLAGALGVDPMDRLRSGAPVRPAPDPESERSSELT